MKRSYSLILFLILTLSACRMEDSGIESPTLQTSPPMPAITSPSGTPGRSNPPSGSEPTQAPPGLALQGTPVSLGTEPITVQTADQVKPLARWGSGVLKYIDLSPDGKTLAVATMIGVALYDAESLSLEQTWLTNGVVSVLEYSPDGSTLAIGLGREVRLWDPASGTIRLTLKPAEHDSVAALAFSPDGKWIAVGTDNGTYVIDTASGQTVAYINDPKEYYDLSKSVVFSPDGLTLTTAQRRGDSGSVILTWDTHTWKLKDRVEEDAFVSKPGALALSADGSLLAIPASQYYVTLRHTADGSTIEARAEYPNLVDVVALSPDGSTLAGGTYYGILYLWDAVTGKSRRTLQADGTPLQALRFSPDGSKLYAAADDGIRLWDLGSGKVIHSALDHASLGRLISFSPDGRRLASVTDTAVTIRDVSTGLPLQSIPGDTYAAISPDWSLLAVAAPDDPLTLLIVDLPTGIILHRINQGNQQNVKQMIFSPDGRVLAQLELSAEKQIHLYEAQRGTLLHSVDVFSPFIDAMAFSADSKVFATVEYVVKDSQILDTIIHFWDVASGAETGSMHVGSKNIQSLAFSPDGKTLVMQDQGQISLRDFPLGNQLWSINSDNGSDSRLIFSADGSYLLSGGRILKTSVILLDAANGQQIGVLPGHTWPLTGLAISPDGTLIASSAGDGTIFLYGIVQ